jgi:hypothetical protein
MLFKRFFFCVFVACSLAAEEGMWTFNNLPLNQIERDYEIKLEPSWIEHVQKSCLRVSLGGSASFVSPQGLVLTNHHVGAKAIYHLSTENRDLMESAFLAKSFDEELKCPNMYVDQLISIRDVTDEVNRVAQESLSAAEREAKRKSAIAEIKQRAKEETGLHPEVVSLYQGARYHLYLYRRYSDVRLVMAPEKSIAFFGGDTDNFEFPRYNLDVCFFRVYHEGKPLASPDYLKWSLQGPQPSEPLFVAGHPGKTNRLFTSAHLRFLKENDVSFLYDFLQNRIEDLRQFSAQSAENHRIALQDFYSCENAFKVYKNLRRELFHSPLIQNKEMEEPGNGAPWLKLQDALEKVKSYYPSYVVLEGGNSSKLYNWAKHLVRLSDERKLPNEKRLKEYADAELSTLELNLFSEEPVYKQLERVFLLGTFKRAIQFLGDDHPAAQIFFGAQADVDPFLASTELHDPAYRKRLYDHPEEVANSADPFILLAKALDPHARAIRQKKEDELDSVQNEAYAEIAKILFEKHGESVYPDATFTLRLSVGSLKGYEEIEPMTTFGGLFERAEAHGFQPPYDIPERWLSKQTALNQDVPFNFVTTNDIIGGNSGSPVINQKGEIVGLIFDGNIHSIVWNFGFDSTKGRATSVHSQGMIEALKTVYGADELVAEIL